MSDASTADALVAADAFYGAGGLSLGLRWAGFRVGATFDNYRAAMTTYRRNLGEHSFTASVTDVTAHQLRQVAATEKFALMAGGPPCQGFSVQRQKSESLDDPRNSLPLAFFAIVKALLPRSSSLRMSPAYRGGTERQFSRHLSKRQRLGATVATTGF